MDPTSYDVIIVGAGPAGTTCALALKHAGLRVAVLDKATFPRDKICGDAIPGSVVKALKAIDPKYAAALEAFSEKVTIRSTRVVAPNNRYFDIHWKNIAYNSPRLDFDNFLFELAQQETKADFYQETALRSVAIDPDKVVISCENGQEFQSAIVVGCGGAHSILAKQLAHIQVDRQHHMGAVRAYYKQVSGIRDELTEIYLLKTYLPGYLWVFPLPHGRVNVGFGMLSQTISERKVNLGNALKDIIATHPLLKERFSKAVLEGPIKGFGLPTGSRKLKVSGERFLLCGDAASLIDPISGDGIGNAMWSGKIAADQIIQCVQQQNFSAEMMSAYDDALYAKLWPELSKHAALQKFLSNKSWVINWGVSLAAGNKYIRRWVQSKV